MVNASQFRGVTPFDGIKSASKGSVTYAQGCERWSNDQSGFAEAVAAASAADVAVVVVGTWSVSISDSCQEMAHSYLHSVINRNCGKV